MTGRVCPSGQINWFGSASKQYAAGKYRLTLVNYSSLDNLRCNPNQNIPIWSHHGLYNEPIATDVAINAPTFTTHGWNNVSANWSFSDNLALNRTNGASAFAISPGTASGFKALVYVDSAQKGNDLSGDFIGICFAMQIHSNGKPRNGYIVSWKASDQPYPGDTSIPSARGLRLIKFTEAAGRTWEDMSRPMWVSENTTVGGMTLKKLYHNTDIANWKFNRYYWLSVIQYPNGDLWLRVADGQTNAVLADHIYRDPSPLSIGRVGFYNQSQAGAYYWGYNFGTTTALPFRGNFCAYKKQAMKITGTSTGITLLTHHNTPVVVNWDGTPGNPITYTVPQNSIFFRNTSGSLVGTRLALMSPGTSAKIIRDGIRVHQFPTGNDNTLGTGNVNDLAAKGFTIRNFGDEISVEDLGSRGWMDTAGNFDFDVWYIPCGESALNLAVSSVSLSSNELTAFDWQVCATGGIGVGRQAPTTVGSSVEFIHNQVGPIGVKHIVTPTGIYDPVYRLEQTELLRPICGQLAPLPLVRGFGKFQRFRDFAPQYLFIAIDPAKIRLPKQAEWIQTNETRKLRTYRYAIQIGDYIFDTDFRDDMKYFRFNGQQWTPGTKNIAPGGQAPVQFILPFDTQEPVARVGVYTNNPASYGELILTEVVDVPLSSRSFVQHPLKFHRDMVTPEAPDITAKLVAMRRNIPIGNYRPFIYDNDTLTEITWSRPVVNGERVVCISKAVTALSQVLRHLRSTRGIMPNRNVGSIFR